MTSITPRRIALAATLVFALLPCHYLLSQADEPPHPPLLPLKPEDVAKWFSGAEENRWRLTTVDPTNQVDTLPPSIRAARNARWHNELQFYRDAEKKGGSISEANERLMSPERPLDPKEIWVVATFDHFLVIPIDPEFNLFYTEMSFKIDRVIHQPSTSSLVPDMLVDMEDAGGQIRKPNGEVETWRIGPHQYYPQPGHTYLMMIGYYGGDDNSRGNLYYFGERWDVSTGAAVPDSYAALACIIHEDFESGVWGGKIVRKRNAAA
jgi:hypothetical protein